VGSYITFPELFIWLPILAGVICFFLAGEKSPKAFAIFASLLVLGVAIACLFNAVDTKYSS
jgi:NADH:ubiquinone oxidoreductase subunit 4 (subunit M)